MIFKKRRHGGIIFKKIYTPAEIVILLKSSPVRQAPLSVESSDMSRSDLKPGFNKTIHKKNTTKIPLIRKNTQALMHYCK